MDTLTALKHLLDASRDRGNPGPEALKEIMASVRTIAVVGISRNPDKPARSVPEYLSNNGFEIIPVNPFIDTILGREAKKTLQEVAAPVDMVLVFRPSEEAARVAEEAMGRVEKPVIWLQKGIRADKVAARARGLGFTFVQDLCAYEVHRAMQAT